MLPLEDSHAPTPILPATLSASTAEFLLGLLQGLTLEVGDPAFAEIVERVLRAREELRTIIGTSDVA